MKDSGSDSRYLPFADLKKLLRRQAAPSSKKAPAATDSRAQQKRMPTSAASVDPAPTADHKDDSNLFLEAVTDVRPLSDTGREMVPCRENAGTSPAIADRGAEQELRRLVENGDGFAVRNTAEYVQGTGYNVHPHMAERLHRGDFSIQEHIDLHGMSVSEARIVFEEFLQAALKADRRSLLIIHGRGLSSPREPILKKKVFEWLTRGVWRKWVIAFASARPEDGGAGATYVLLRRRPATKKVRRKKDAAFLCHFDA